MPVELPANNQSSLPTMWVDHPGHPAQSSLQMIAVPVSWETLQVRFPSQALPEVPTHILHHQVPGALLHSNCNQNTPFCKWGNWGLKSDLTPGLNYHFIRLPDVGIIKFVPCRRSLSQVTCLFQHIHQQNTLWEENCDFAEVKAVYFTAFCD